MLPKPKSCLILNMCVFSHLTVLKIQAVFRKHSMDLLVQDMNEDKMGQIQEFCQGLNFMTSSALFYKCFPRNCK